MEPFQCTTCDKFPQPARLSTTFQVGDVTLTEPVDGYKCECGEEFLLGDHPAGAGLSLLDAERSAALKLARSGRVSAASFRFLRGALGWSSKETARRLGVAPESVSRWENGAREVDRFAWLLLAALLQESIAGRDDIARLLESLHTAA